MNKYVYGPCHNNYPYANKMVKTDIPFLTRSAATSLVRIWLSGSHLASLSLQFVYVYVLPLSFADEDVPLPVSLLPLFVSNIKQIKCLFIS